MRRPGISKTDAVCGVMLQRLKLLKAQLEATVPPSNANVS